MSPLLKCIPEKRHFSMLTGREGQCFNARAYLLLFLKNQKDMHPYVSLGWKESLGKDVTG